jgi:hypothetical protein
MSLPGFTAEVSLITEGRKRGVYQNPATPQGSVLILPQLGFGFGGGVTGPVDDDEPCYACVSWIRVPCGLV